MERPTTIATLHAAYARADVAYTINDEAICEKKIAEADEYTAEIAMTALNEHTETLRTAILREMPTDMQDAMILSWHASAAAEYIADCNLEKCPEVKALPVALQNIVAFLSRQPGVVIEEGSWFAEQMGYSLRHVAARNVGRKEAP